MSALLSATTAAQTWHRLETEHVSLLTTDDARGRAILRAFALLDRLLGPPSSAPATVLTLSEEAFRPFDPQRHLYSFFARTSDRSFIIFGPRARGPEFIHEYVHYLSATRGWESSPWLHEGLAVALSSMEDQPGRLVIPARNTYDGIGCGGVLPLSKLLQSRDFHEGSLNESQLRYRTAGRFVHLLLARKGVSGLLAIAAGAQKEASVASIASRLGVSGEELEKEFDRYCGLPVLVELPSLQSTSPQTSLATPQDSEEELASLMVRSPGLTAAGHRYFANVLAKDPGNQKARVGLGIAYTTSGRYSDAVREFSVVRGYRGLDDWKVYWEVACRRVQGCASESEGDATDPASSVIMDRSTAWGCKDGCDWRSAAVKKRDPR